MDETIYVLEGGMTIKDAGGTHHLNAGDTIYFPAGVSAEWIVKSYVRKIAFVRTQLPRSLASARRVYQHLKRVVHIGDRAPAGQLGSR
jgi:ethanolamine utilization protein EutQ (cupin superfamily)